MKSTGITQNIVAHHIVADRIVESTSVTEYNPKALEREAIEKKNEHIRMLDEK